MADINEVFGQEIKEAVEEKYKAPSISPFDFINSITYTKQNLIVDDWSEKQYNAYVINKGLSYSPDTVILANEMNSRPHLEKALQNSFLINIIRSRKRFNKWIKADKVESLEVIKNYYGYSNEKAKQVLSILTKEQLKQLEEKLQKGGIE